MERQASYAVVGFITLLLLSAFGAFTFWFVQSGFNNSYADYNVEFNFPVDGLSKGAEVHFNGIKVGEVTALKLGKENSSLVIATVKVDSTTPIRSNSMATLEPQGVTGLAYINISPGSPKGVMIVFDPLKPLHVIASTESRLSKLLSGSGSVIQDAYETVSRVNTLLSDSNIKAFSNSLTNLEAVTKDIRAREQLINDAHEAIRSTGQAADAVSALAQSSNQLISRDAPLTFQRIEEASNEVSKASQATEKLALSLQGPANQLTQTTLPQLEESMKNLDETSKSLKDLADEARASPQGFAAKGEAKERKINP